MVVPNSAFFGVDNFPCCVDNFLHFVDIFFKNEAIIPKNCVHTHIYYIYKYNRSEFVTCSLSERYKKIPYFFYLLSSKFSGFDATLFCYELQVRSYELRVTSYENYYINYSDFASQVIFLNARYAKNLRKGRKEYYFGCFFFAHFAKKLRAFALKTLLKATNITENNIN